MKFLSNTYDPRLPNARKYLPLSLQAAIDPKMADFEWQQHLDWVNRNIIGRPKATDHYTVEELEVQGVVGIYSAF